MLGSQPGSKVSIGLDIVVLAFAITYGCLTDWSWGDTASVAIWSWLLGLDLGFYANRRD